MALSAMKCLLGARATETTTSPSLQAQAVTHAGEARHALGACHGAAGALDG